MSLGMPEVLVILGICVLLFGPKQLPKLGRSLGESIKSFRDVGKELSSLHDEEK